MVVKIRTKQRDGEHEYVGHVLTRGPSRIVMILTEPYHTAGDSVTFHIADVLSEELLEGRVAS